MRSSLRSGVAVGCPGHAQWCRSEQAHYMENIYIICMGEYNTSSATEEPLNKGHFMQTFIFFVPERLSMSFFEGQKCMCITVGSIVATIFVLYRGVALLQGSICTKSVRLGLREMAFIVGHPHITSGSAV